VTLAHRLATYADLEALPEDVKAEIFDGVLETQPGPMPRHGRTQGVISGVVGIPFDYGGGAGGGPGGWWIIVEVDVQLGPHRVVRPDIAGWRRERLAKPDVRPIPVVPDWVCEIVSPSSGSRDRVTKRRYYAEHGVAHYWIVDPEARTLEALELRDGSWHDLGPFDDADVARVAPFEAVEIVVGQLFLPPEARDDAPAP
jgi:Uma2 family endonuclease